MSHTFAICPSCHSLNKVDADRALQKAATCGKCQAPLQLHGLMSHASAEDFQRILAKSDIPVVVDFWASWCGPCRMYGPEFERASTLHKNAVFLKIDTEANPQLSQQLGIRGIPCTIVFKNGKEVRRQAGAMSAEQVGSLL
jgi:thioredoxin 2